MPDKPLTVGMVGEQIADLHRALAAAGIPVAEHERTRRFFGPETKRAVSDYQRRQGLAVTGEVGQETAVVLSSLAVERSTTETPAVLEVLEPHASAFGSPAPIAIRPLDETPATKGERMEWLLKGMLESTPSATSFAGCRIETFFDRIVSGADSRAVSIPIRLTAFSDAAGSFSLLLPDRGEIANGQLKLAVSAPAGEPMATATIGLEQVTAPLTIKVPPPQQVVLTTTDAPDVARIVRGQVIERNGKSLPANLQVLVWGRTAATTEGEKNTFQPLFVAKTDGSGHFSANAPTTAFAESFATVTGIEDPVPVWLEDGLIPRRMLLVVELDDVTAAGPDKDCHCDDAAMVPRTPTQEDIASAPGVFSADLGAGCIRFNVPNRAIEEFDFYTVVRTTEPGIRGLTVEEIVETVIEPPPPPSTSGGTGGQGGPVIGGSQEAATNAADIEQNLRAVFSGWQQSNGVWDWEDIEREIIRVIKDLKFDLKLGFFLQFYEHGWRKSDRFDLFKTPVFDAVLTAAARTAAGLTDSAPASTSGSGSGSVGLVSTSYAATAADTRNQTKSIVNTKQVAKEIKELLHQGLWERLATRGPTRVALQADNPIDWDSTPTFFEAATIAHGHLLHFKQVWYADGYSLGDLLYSLPLAPGQKKLISVIDWERRERTTREEQTFGDESVGARLSRDRDLTEVVSGALSESARGGSKNSTWGIGAGHGGAMNGSYQAYNFGALHGVSGGYGESNTDAFLDASRNLSSSSLQSLRDQTLQSASAVRSLRSTIVQTAAQGEAVRATTEVIANHNHCHALTIQYFEVLRHLKVTHELADVQECLFVPLPMKPFDRPKTLRWRQPLSTYLQRRDLGPAFDAVRRVQTSWAEVMTPVDRYADERVLEIFGELTLTILIPLPPFPEKPKPSPGETIEQTTEKLNQTLNPTASFFGAVLAIATGGVSAMIGAGVDAGKTVAQGGRALAESLLNEPTAEERYARFQQEVMPSAAAGFVDRLEVWAVAGSTDVRLQGMDFTLVSDYRPGAPLLVSVRGQLSTPVSRGSISALIIKSSVPLPQGCRAIVNSATLRYRTQLFEHSLVNDSRVNDDIDLPVVAMATGAQLQVNTSVIGLPHWIPVPGTILISAGSGAMLSTPIDVWEQRSPRKEDMRLAAELVEHLNDNLEYYHHAIWWAMDPNRRYMLLDGYLAPNSNGRSVSSVVENKLIGIVGNSLVMPVAPGNNLDPRFRAERDQQGRIVDGKLKDYYALPSPVAPSRISLPTRGVFAEAVMGDCNACEKIDDSRFWRWEDSPIDEPPPLDATAVASRRTETNFGTPTPFPAPIVSIQNAPAAPEPAGVRAVLDTISKQSFADITGVAGTQANAAMAYSKALDTAMQFGKEASVLAQQAATIKNKDKIFESIDKAEEEGKISEEDQSEYYKRTLDGMTPPPLVQAKGSLPEEWEQWPTSREEEWEPWPGEEDQGDLKHGDGGSEPDPKKPPQRARLVPVSVKLKVFVRPELWVAGGMVVNGDKREFGQPGSSRAEIEYSFRLNTNTFEAVDPAEKVVYGLARVHNPVDGEQVQGRPAWWWKKKKDGVRPWIETRLKNDEGYLIDTDLRQNALAVRIKFGARLYFPWADVPSVIPEPANTVLSGLISLGLPDMDAEIVVTFGKDQRGRLQYIVSGTHDKFPAYEVFVNGAPVYRFGGDAVLPGDVIDAMRTEWPVIAQAPRLLPAPVTSTR